MFSLHLKFCVDVLHRNVKCRFITVYRPTDMTSQSEEHTRQLVHCLKNLIHVRSPCYITGEINAPNISWFTPAGPASQSHTDNVLLDFITDYGFSQIVNAATRNESLLDLVLVSEPNTIFSMRVDPPFGSSDHFRVSFSIALENQS